MIDPVLAESKERFGHLQDGAHTAGYDWLSERLAAYGVEISLLT